MTQSFHPVTPVELSHPTTDAWTDLDVSSYVPEGATGVILHLYQEVTSDEDCGFRKNGSTDDRHSKTGHDYFQFWLAVGIDSNRVFEYYLGHATEIDIYLVGYTTSGVTFATNGTDKSLGTTGSWQDIDCSSEAPSATGLIFEVTGRSGYWKQYGFRRNGSSDNRHRIIAEHSNWGVIIGCDGSQICEGYIEDSAIDCWLVGYVTDGATFNTNATDLSLGTTGAWTDLAALPAGAIMGFIEVYTTSWIRDFGLRKNGSSEDLRDVHQLEGWAIVECDSNRKIEGWIQDTNVDFFLVGYALGAAAGFPRSIGIITG